MEVAPEVWNYRANIGRVWIPSQINRSNCQRATATSFSMSQWVVIISFTRCNVKSSCNLCVATHGVLKLSLLKDQWHLQPPSKFHKFHLVPQSSSRIYIPRKIVYREFTATHATTFARELYRCTGGPLLAPAPAGSRDVFIVASPEITSRSRAKPKGPLVKYKGRKERTWNRREDGRIAGRPASRPRRAAGWYAHWLSSPSPPWSDKITGGRGVSCDTCWEGSAPPRDKSSRRWCSGSCIRCPAAGSWRRL